MRAGIAAFLAAALLMQGCAEPPRPSTLRIVNLVESADAEFLAVRICPESYERACETHGLRQGKIRRDFSMRPGRYRISLSTSAGPLTEASYGIGSDREYALVAYGIAAPPVRVGSRAKAKDLLGGIDERIEAGFQVQMHMLMMTPPAAGDPAELRLANFAPGLTAIEGRVDIGAQSAKLAPTRYAAVGDPVKLGRSEGRLTLSLAGSPIALEQRSLPLPPGSLSIAYVYGMDESRPRLIVDSEASVNEE